MINKTIVILQGSDIIKKINEQPAKEIPGKISTGDNFLQLIGLVLILIIILAAAYFTTRFVGNVKLSQLKNSNFQVIDTYRISPNKLMQVVKVGNKYIVIAIGKETVNFITELEESEVFLREPGNLEKQSFKQVLEKLRHNK